MSAQPTGTDPPRGTSEDAVKRQLEALVNGECDHVAFLDAMKERFHLEPDENWEVLSMLDQYFRRGKISQEVFRAIKNGFAEYILGPQVARPPLQTVPSPAPIQIPVPTPPAAAPAAPAAKAMPAAPNPGATSTAPASSAGSQASAARAGAAAPREVRVGDVLRDRYRIEAVLARGSSGTVYEINDAYRLNLPPSGKRLAAKLPRMPDPRGNFLGQLRNEFQQLQYLSHPNIVRAFDFDRDGSLSFFTMEMLNGMHLPKILQANDDQLLPRAHALAIIRDVGAAIAYAHARGVIHGDVNPQNVFITMSGEIRLLGFGAAHKLSTAVPTLEFERASAASDTQRYASCEVFEGDRPGVQDDIYSLSCLAYLLLTAKHPYADTTSVEARATRSRPRRPAGLSYQQWRTLRAGLSTDANKRPGSAQEWLDAMELRGATPRLPSANELIASQTDKPRAFRFAAAAAVIVALIGGGYYWYSTSFQKPTLPPLVGESATEDSATPPAETPSAETPSAETPSAAPPAAVAPAAVAQPPAVSPQRPPAAATAATQPAKPSPVAKPSAAPSTQRPSTATVPTTPAVPPSAATASSAAASSAAAPAAAASSSARVAGNTRVEMAVDTMDALPSDTAVHVTVRRKGNLHGVTSFIWWTESGTAKPGVDFSPVLPHVEQMQDGESSTVLTVPLISTVRAQSKGFYVGIEANEGGAQIGARSLTQITLPPTN
jgi:serine/threonine protein kinase